MSTTMIIGVGNPYRGDDCVGLIIARRLKHSLGDLVCVLEQSGEGAALLEAWRGAQTLIIIDAVKSGAEAGSIHRFDAQERMLPGHFFHYSTHAFAVAEAIELARALGELPPRVVVYGIEGKNFAAGTELSEEVREAVSEVVKRIEAECEPMSPHARTTDRYSCWNH